MTLQPNSDPYNAAPYAEPETLSPWNPFDYARVALWMFIWPERIERIWKPKELLIIGEPQQALVSILQRNIALIVWLPALIVDFWLCTQVPIGLSGCLPVLLPVLLVTMIWTSEATLPNLEFRLPRSGKISGLFFIPEMFTRSMPIFIAIGLATNEEKPDAAVTGWVLVMAIHLISWGLAWGYIEPRLPLPPRGILRQRWISIPKWGFTTEQVMHTFMLSILTGGGISAVIPYSEDQDGRKLVMLLGLAVIVAFVVALYFIAKLIGRAFYPHGGSGGWFAIRWSLLMILVISNAALIWLLWFDGWKTF